MADSPSLPAELIQLISNDCPRSSLVLLNRYYYHSLTPALYKDIFLLSVPQLFAFAWTMTTGRVSLREYPTSIYIDPAEATYSELVSLSLPVKQSISLTPHLSKLALCLPRFVTFHVFQNSQYSFSLRRLAVRPIASPGFRDFLHSQKTLEGLNFLDSVHGQRFETPIRESIALFEPDAFPNLRFLAAELGMLENWLPRYPISMLRLTKPISVDELRIIENLILRSLTPWTNLHIAVHLPWQNHPLGVIETLLSSIRDGGEMLKDLSVQIVSPPSPRYNSALAYFRVSSGFHKRAEYFITQRLSVKKCTLTWAQVSQRQAIALRRT
jgi:hypothetical protein